MDGLGTWNFKISLGPAAHTRWQSGIEAVLVSRLCPPPPPHRRRAHTPLCAPHVHSPTSFQVRVCLQAWVGKLTTRRSNRKPPDSLSSKCGGTEAHRRLFLSAFVCDLHKFACVSQSHHTQFGKQLKVNPLHLCQPMAGQTQLLSKLLWLPSP